jgi:hypothetical protein
MHHAVAIRSSADQPWLGVADSELAVRAGPVAESPQFFLQAQQLIFQIGVEHQHCRPKALPPLSAMGGGMEAGKAGEAGIDVA